jgi:hypothetical protein
MKQVRFSGLTAVSKDPANWFKEYQQSEKTQHAKYLKAALPFGYKSKRSCTFTDIYSS